MTSDSGASSPSFQRLTRSPQVSSSVAEQILSQIAQGALLPGSRLPSEAELAKTFGVSRPSIREALAALQFAGHVESRRGFGTVVLGAAPATGSVMPRRLRTLAEAVDLLEARLVVEPAALALAAADPVRPALSAARELISGMRTAVDETVLDVSTDLRVHRALLAVCRNTILRDSALAMVDISLDPMLSTARTHAWSSPSLPHAWADQHESVHDAIVAGDPEATRRHCLEHLGSVVENLAAATTDEPGVEHRIEALLAQVGRTRPAPPPSSSPMES